MIRRPPRSTRVRSSAASDVYKRQLQHPVNITGGEVILEIPADTMEWCVFVLYFSWVQTSDCTEATSLPPILNASTGLPLPGIDQYEETIEISVPLSLEGLGEGEVAISISLEDWAGNTHHRNWSMTMDSIAPEISWVLSPSSGDTLGDHVQNLSWCSESSLGTRKIRSESPPQLRSRPPSGILPPKTTTKGSARGPPVYHR